MCIVRRRKRGSGYSTYTPVLSLSAAIQPRHCYCHRLLEVGALLPDNFASCSRWIDNTPIDLRSRHPSIREQDFLLMDEEGNREKWDVISLSLVVNFVPEARDRGSVNTAPVYQQAGLRDVHRANASFSSLDAPA